MKDRRRIVNAQSSVLAALFWPTWLHGGLGARASGAYNSVWKEKKI